METTLTRFKPELLSEVRVSLGLVVPLLVTQLCETGINAVNVVMIGLLGTQSLAAGALGAIAFYTFIYVGYGMISGVGALAAEAYGAGKTDQIGRIASQGLWLVAAMSLPIILLIWNFDSILLLFGQEESNAVLAKTYTRAIAWGFPAAIGFLLLKDIAYAINHPRFVTGVMVAGLLLNVPANYILIFGKLGFPPLGLAGSGGATASIYWVTFLAVAGFLGFHPNLKDYKIFGYLHQFDKALFLKIFQTGWAMGIHYGSEIALLNMTTWLMGYLGTEKLAAHEIAIQTAEICMAIPIAISYATVMRVGQMLGEKELLGARRAASVGITFGVIFALAIAGIFWLFPDRIAGIYLDFNNPDNRETLSTAAEFLQYAALFEIAYSIQMIAVGALLGLQDTRVPMLINLLAFWVVGLGGGYLMALPLGWGGIGLWWGLILGPTLSGVILVWRFYWVISSKIAACADV